VKYEGARDLKSFTDFVDDHISQAPAEETATKVTAITTFLTLVMLLHVTLQYHRHFQYLL